MKKLYFLLMTLLVSFAANSKTVYFENTANWGTVKAYVWEGGTGNSWSGDVVTNKITADNGKTYYYFETDCNKIIWNNGTAQTKDLKAEDGAVYSYAANNQSTGTADKVGTITKQGDTYHFVAAGAVELVEGHLYFVIQAPYTNNCNLHSWSPQITSKGYPGDALTKTKLGDGYEYWTLTVKDNRELDGITPGLQLNTASDVNKKEKQAVGPLHDGDIININFEIVGNAIKGTYPANGGQAVPEVDYSGYWIALGGAFNNYDYFNAGKKEAQPNTAGIATFSNIAIGGNEFEIKQWDGSNDTYFNYSAAPVVPGVATKLSHSEDGTHVTIANYKAGNEYTIAFNCKTQEVTLTLTKEGEGDEDPDPEIDYTSYWMALGGAFNNYDYFNDGKLEANPTAEGIVTFSNIAIGGNEFEIKQWDGKNDTYFNYSASPVVVGEATKLSHSEDGTHVVIADYKDGNEYTFVFDCKTQEVTLTLTKEGKVTYPESLYIIGHVNDCDFDGYTGVVSEEANEGVYKFTVEVRDADQGKGYLQFATQLGEKDDNWAGMNAGTRYGAANDNTPLTTDAPAELTAYTGDNAGNCKSFEVAAGKYVVTTSLPDKTVSIEAVTEPEPEVDTNNLYLIVTTDPTDWNIENGTVYTGDNEGDGFFRFDNVALGTEDVPAATADAVDTGSSEYFYFLFFTKYTNGTVATVYGSTEKTDMVIVDTATPGTEIVPEAAFEEYDSFDAAGEYAFQIGTTNADLYFSMDDMIYTAEANDNTTTGVANIAADSTDAPVVYYNLQGVRVANPENGLYIRVQGKSASKVLVK